MLGHCRRGDMENGEGMLKVMQENGLCPTATSYAALLCGHADRGDMDRVEQVIGIFVLLVRERIGSDCEKWGRNFSGANWGKDMPTKRPDNFCSPPPPTQLLEEMRERRVFPSVGVYASLLDRLSLSGHSDLLPRALDLVPDKQLVYNGNHGNRPHPVHVICNRGN